MTDGPGGGASTSSVVIEAPPDRVFDVLVDPVTYPDWLVGAQRIKAVDDNWPTVGSRFRHRIGFGPVGVSGSTSVRRCDRPHELCLAAGMGPFGEAAVRFVLAGAPGGTEVLLQEEPAKGLARVSWRLWRSGVSAALWGRNVVSLAALERSVLPT